MDPEEKGVFTRILEMATGITAITTVLVLSSVAGMGAYLAYQPSALEAQAVGSQNVIVATSTASTACQQEIATAAARGSADTQSIITEQNSQFQDQCVAAILNPAGTGLGPNNPGSYICVGKSAKVNVAGSGAITETAVPDPTVPAGTCTAVACTSYGANGQSDCIASNSLTSLNGTAVENDLSSAQSATLSPDQNITSFTLNADGSIANENGATASILDSGAGSQGLAANSVHLEQAAASQSASLTGGTPSIGEEQAVGVEVPGTQAAIAAPPEPVVVAPAPVTPAPVAVSASAAVTPPTPLVPAAAAPAPAAVVPPEALPSATQATAPVDTGVPVLVSPDLSGPQAITPTLDQVDQQIVSAPNTSGTASNTVAPVAPVGTQPENLLERTASTITNESVSVINEVRSWFGLAPLGQGADTPTQVGSLGIRG